MLGVLNQQQKIVKEDQSMVSTIPAADIVGSGIKPEEVVKMIIDNRDENAPTNNKEGKGPHENLLVQENDSKEIEIKEEDN